MASQRHARWTGKYPPGGPAEWLADGHVTCNIQCSGGKCDRRMVDVRLDSLPQDLPWSTIGRRLVCKQCRTAGSVHIVPNWHDRTAAAVPFTKHWNGSGRPWTLNLFHGGESGSIPLGSASQFFNDLPPHSAALSNKWTINACAQGAVLHWGRDLRRAALRGPMDAARR